MRILGSRGARRDLASPSQHQAAVLGGDDAQQGIVKRDRFDPAGATTFQTNLFRPSCWVGMTPQLVAYDVDNNGGLLVGQNAEGQALVKPGADKTWLWYAGDITATKSAGQFTLNPTPVEFGGANIMPADRVKQGAKSLVGALVVEPANASWPGSDQNLNRRQGTLFVDLGDLAQLVDTQNDHQATSGPRKTRAQATVTIGSTVFRDFSLVLTKGLSQYYKDASPVEHMNGQQNVSDKIE